jgi:F420-non-reducing hydrogenase small subunit
MSPTDKPKVAFYWCASCGGCEETVVDLHERLLDVAQAVDLVFWPVALDFKRRDVESMPDGGIDITFLNGAIRTTEHEEMARLLRRKSRLLVAFGACAQLGGIPGLANAWTREAVLETVYRHTPSTDNTSGTYPTTRHEEDGRAVELPALLDTVRTLEEVVAVDYAVPGCPPTAQLLADAVAALLSPQLPPAGAVLAPDRAVCETCPRKDSRPEQLLLTEFKRPHEVEADQEQCLLAQGLACLGPATRGGCESRCITGNMPCTGCFGPTSRVRDFGAKALSGLASVLDATEAADIDRKLDALADPLGTFYRYSLAGGLAGSLRPAGKRLKAEG